MGKDEVLHNPSVREAIYKDEVLLDSGATDCMTHRPELLDLITSAFVTVCIADGMVHDSNHKGVMKIKATDVETGESRTIPMDDSYLAPGLRITLWAVPALCRAGHTVRFGFSTVPIILNDGMDNQTILHLHHP